MSSAPPGGPTVMVGFEDCPGGVVLCDASGLPADAETVDALARLHLAARRKGCQVRLRGASAELVALVAFMGLADVIPPADAAAGRTAGTACPSPGRS